MKKLVVLASIIVLSVSLISHAETLYTMTDLGTLGGSESRAMGINDSGQVVGHSEISGNSAQHTFIYDGTTMTDLGTLGGSESRAYGINDSGTAVGSSRISGNSAQHAFIYDGTTDGMIDLNTFLPAESDWDSLEYASDINNSGQIVGTGIINFSPLSRQ